MRLTALKVFIVTLLSFMPLTAKAISTDWIKYDEVEYRIIVGNAQENDYGDTIIQAGIEYKLLKNWHTYWRTPGDAGVPLTFNLEGSENLESIDIKWPAPERHLAYGAIQTYIYHDSVVFPMTLHIEDGDKDVTLKAASNHMVCEEICIPLQDEFTLTIPANHSDDAMHAIIKEARKQLPRKNGYKGVSINSASINGDKLTITAYNKKGFSDESDIFIEQEGDNFRFLKYENAALSDDKTTITYTIPVEALLEDSSLAGKLITLTLVDGKISIEHTLNVIDAKDIALLDAQADLVKKKL